MHLKRWLTAIIALPILIYLIGFSPRWIFYLFLLFFALAGLNEFYRLTIPEFSLFIKSVIFLLVSLFFVLLIIKGPILMAFGMFSLIIIVPMLYFLFSDPLKGERYLSEVGKIAVGPIYVCLPLAMLIMIDQRYLFNHSISGIWIFFLLVVTFANDTGAFYSGKLFGKHKLYETVSPKKTWEGSVGGVLFAFFVGIAFMKIFDLHEIDFSIFLIIFLLSVSGQIGDLAESMLKRSFNVKDSGTLLPGHGGILDRIDSLLFAAPVLYIYLEMMIYLK